MINESSSIQGKRIDPSLRVLKKIKEDKCLLFAHGKRSIFFPDKTTRCHVFFFNQSRMDHKGKSESLLLIYSWFLECENYKQFPSISSPSLLPITSNQTILCSICWLDVLYSATVRSIKKLLLLQNWRGNMTRSSINLFPA